MSDHRPVIGVSCYVEDVDRDPWVGQRSAVLPQGYVAHLEGAGALVVLLPPRRDADDVMAREVLSRLDGLVIAGGADIESRRYAGLPHPDSQPPRPDRDAWELALARVSAARDLPVLGICRGMQVMAVAVGGTLDQHLPDLVGHDAHSPKPGVYTSHHVAPVPGTRTAALLGTASVDVPTYHHQSVRAASLAGTAYVASAWHADGTLEAMEDPTSTFRLAVQWHPEMGEDGRLFRALTEAAGAGAGGR
ncbi:MAG: gamma-glutamyl-gamma-aminobutyrate hydrolase family protein [Ornithinibacter sp.]